MHAGAAASLYSWPAKQGEMTVFAGSIAMAPRFSLASWDSVFVLDDLVQESVLVLPFVYESQKF